MCFFICTNYIIRRLSGFDYRISLILTGIYLNAPQFTLPLQKNAFFDQIRLI